MLNGSIFDGDPSYSTSFKIKLAATVAIMGIGFMLASVGVSPLVSMAVAGAAIAAAVVVARVFNTSDASPEESESENKSDHAERVQHVEKIPEQEKKVEAIPFSPVAVAKKDKEAEENVAKPVVHSGDVSHSTPSPEPNTAPMSHTQSASLHDAASTETSSHQPKRWSEDEKTKIASQPTSRAK